VAKKEHYHSVEHCAPSTRHHTKEYDAREFYHLCSFGNQEDDAPCVLSDTTQESTTHMKVNSIFVCLGAKKEMLFAFFWCHQTPDQRARRIARAHNAARRLSLSVIVYLSFVSH
jgi:hypothetical protein